MNPLSSFWLCLLLSNSAIQDNQIAHAHKWARAKKVMIDGVKVGTGSTDEKVVIVGKPLVNRKIVTGMFGYP